MKITSKSGATIAAAAATLFLAGATMTTTVAYAAKPHESRPNGIQRLRARLRLSSCVAIATGSVTGYEQNVLVHAKAAGPSG